MFFSHALVLQQLSLLLQVLASAAAARHRRIRFGIIYFLFNSVGVQIGKSAFQISGMGTLSKGGLLEYRPVSAGPSIRMRFTSDQARRRNTPKAQLITFPYRSVILSPFSFAFSGISSNVTIDYQNLRDSRCD